jgi:hypothetical protein
MVTAHITDVEVACLNLIRIHGNSENSDFIDRLLPFC